MEIDLWADALSNEQGTADSCRSYGTWIIRVLRSSTNIALLTELCVATMLFHRKQLRTLGSGCVFNGDDMQRVDSVGNPIGIDHHYDFRMKRDKVALWHGQLPPVR